MQKMKTFNSKKIKNITKTEKYQIEHAVKKAVKEYGEALRMLGSK